MPTLIESALEVARKDSYSPYSGFAVGCAVELSDGTLSLGANQENASYAMCLCAERVAISKILPTILNDPSVKVIKMAIASPNLSPNPVMPCGACRQVMSELVLLQGCDFEIQVEGKSSFSVAELLPESFVLSTSSQ